MGRLVHTDVLDARHREEFDIHPTECAANIPARGLANRVYELPPRGALIRIADTGPEANEALEVLNQIGRRGEFTLPRYSEPTPNRYRLWAPTEFLAEQTRDFPVGRALCLACGAGREAVWLAAHGWQVTALDILPDALDRGRELEKRYSVPGSPPIDWRETDLRAALSPEYAGFDLVTQFRFWNQMTRQRLRPCLAPRGIALLEFFAAQQRPNQKLLESEGDPWSPADWTGWNVDWRAEGDLIRARVCFRS